MASNTTTWQAGQSGNPKGRAPRDRELANLLAKLLRRKNDQGTPHRDAMLQKLVDLAEGGNIEAIKVVLDRVDGKAIERIEHTGPNGGPIEVTDARDDLAARLAALTARRGADRADSESAGAAGGKDSV